MLIVFPSPQLPQGTPKILPPTLRREAWVFYTEFETHLRVISFGQHKEVASRKAPCFPLTHRPVCGGGIFDVIFLNQFIRQLAL